MFHIKNYNFHTKYINTKNQHICATIYYIIYIVVCATDAINFFPLHIVYIYLSFHFMRKQQSKCKSFIFIPKKDTDLYVII